MVRSVFGLFGFTSRAITPAWGTELGDQIESFGHQLDVDEADAGEIAAWPGEAGD